MSAERIRRQVYELTPSDLECFPVWEFALDEEGEEGQDEATVRPYQMSVPLDPSEGMFIVRATLTLSDGTRFRGYVTPSTPDATGLDAYQPAVVAAEGQVAFWCGMVVPPPEHIAKSYALLGKTSPQQVFPIRFESDVPLAGGPIAGEAPGFVILEDFKTMRTRVVA